MGSMLKFDSDRRELVRERRNARIERKLERRQARERKHSHATETPPTPSTAQRLAEREVQAEVDRIVIDALDRHERIAPTATPPAASTRIPEMPETQPELPRTSTLPPAGARSGSRARRVASATSPRSGSVAARRSRRRGPTRGGGSRTRGSRRRSLTRSRRSSTPRRGRGGRSASSSRRRSRPGGPSRSAPPPAGHCGRSAAMPRATPGERGATRSSRWRCAWPTRSSRGCPGRCS